MLSNQFRFTPDAVTVTQVVANLGAMTGGTTVGYCSQIFGRRFSIISICIIGGALLYPYTFVKSHSVTAAAFFEQFCVQGAWGVIPIHLMELSPGSFRTFVVGTSYQLGNLASSASSTIEAQLGENYPLPSIEKEGKTVARYYYGKVICIFMGAVYAYVILLTFIGPEYRGRNLNVEHDLDMNEVTGQGHVVGHDHAHVGDSGSEEEKAVRKEKETV
jgi:MFS transporter, SHS family, lactate transporter